MDKVKFIKKFTRTNVNIVNKKRYYDIEENDLDWLIEQAEKVDKLQDDIKQLNALLDGTNNIIERKIAETRCEGE